MRVFHADPGNSIPLGKQGENNSLQVLFDTNTLFPGEGGEERSPFTLNRPVLLLSIKGN